MVGSRRGGGRRKKLMGNHQRSWVWGRNAVSEILRFSRWPIAELYLDQALPAEVWREVSEAAEAQNIVPEKVSAERIEQLCHRSDHQGYLARMRPFPYENAEFVLQRIDSERPLFVVLLDRLQDPHNFGAILRSAETLGVDAVVVGSRHQAEVNSQVARSSAGAVNRIPIVRVDSLVTFAEQLRKSGLRLVAASEKAETTIDATDFRTATALLLGNEGDGVDQALLALCDAQVAIPQSGAIGSLNVAAAAAILFYEVARQRK